MPDIPNLDMVTIYLEQAHDARICADHPRAQSAAAIALVYATLAIGETLTSPGRGSATP